MSISKIIRAWKDEEYRNSLSAEELAALPDHPSGLIELDDEMLRFTTGGLTETLCHTEGGGSSISCYFSCMGCGSSGQRVCAT